MTHGQAGKGDRFRPVDRKKWNQGYERVFGRKPSFFESIWELEKILDETNRQDNDENQE